MKKNTPSSCKFLIEAVNEGVAAVTRSGILMFCNRRFANMLGFPLKKITGTNILKFIQKKEFLKLRSVLSGRKKTIQIRSALKKNKRMLPVLISGSAVNLEGKRIVLVITDLSQQKKIENELIENRDKLNLLVKERTAKLIRSTERKLFKKQLLKVKHELEDKVQKRTEQVLAERQRLYSVLETLPAYVILLDRDYRVPFANKVFRERFGESKGRRCYEFLFNREEPCENCETYKVLKTNMPHHWEWQGPDGKIYDIFDFPFMEVDGSTIILEMGIDVTERKLAEIRLQRERKLLFDVLESLPAMICLLTPDHHVTFSNLTFRQRFGESNGRHCHEYIFSNKKPCGFCQSYRVFETGKPHRWELSSDGSHLECFAIPFTDVDGSALILEMNMDITTQKQNELELNKHKDKLEELIAERTCELSHKNTELNKILDTSPAIIFYKDKDNRIIRVNKAFEEAFNVPKEQIEGKSLLEVFSRDAAEALWEDDLEVIKSGEAMRGVIETVDTPRGKRILRIEKVPYLNEVGIIQGIIGFAVDITEQKNAEEILKRDKDTFKKLVKEETEELMKSRLELEKTKRLSDIGILAATVAHELRNPLAAIGMAAHNIKRKIEAGNPDIDKHLVNITKKISESDQIINNLLFYSRLRFPVLESVNIFEILEEAVEQVKQKVRKNTVVTAKIKPLKKIVIDIDPTQIKEVLYNILNNAADAVSNLNAGRIKILSKARRDKISILVIDNGEGIDKDVLPKIFDPFFTTKAKGTGLGLSVCRQVIDLHDGSISVKSSAGRGAAVTIILPRQRKNKKLEINPEQTNPHLSYSA